MNAPAVELVPGSRVRSLLDGAAGVYRGMAGGDAVVLWDGDRWPDVTDPGELEPEDGS